VPSQCLDSCLTRLIALYKTNSSSTGAVAVTVAVVVVEVVVAT